MLYEVITRIAQGQDWQAVAAAQAQKTGPLFRGIRVDGAAEHAAIVGHQPEWLALQAHKASDNSVAETGAEFQKRPTVGKRPDYLADIV